MSEHIFTTGSVLGDHCIYCYCSEDERNKPCIAQAIEPSLEGLSARLDAVERELASLRERHDKAISLLSDVVLQNTKLNERLMRVEGWMKAELRAK